MKYNRKEIMKKQHKYMTENKDNKSNALKKAWKEAKINRAFKENKLTIDKICWRYAFYFKLDKNELVSKANELFISIYDKYLYTQIPFKKYLYIQLCNYLKMYCKKEILRKKREDILYYTNHVETEIKEKERMELSELSKKILSYCIEQNTKKEVVYQNRKYKDKVYKYEKGIKKISKQSIRDYFMKFYKGYQIEDAFNEIKYILKKELI